MKCTFEQLREHVDEIFKNFKEDITEVQRAYDTSIGYIYGLHFANVIDNEILERLKDYVYELTLEFTLYLKLETKNERLDV